MWRQTSPRRALLDFADPARYGGRYHRSGEAGVWYASLSERGAWSELFRHWTTEGVSPFEVRRRVGRARAVDLHVVDVTNPDVRAALSVTEGQLVDDDLAQCRVLADHIRNAGFDGILAPSAALPGERTLVVFPAAMAKVTEEHSRVQRPPIRLVNVVHLIRLPEGLRATVGSLYATLRRSAQRLRR